MNALHDWVQSRRDSLTWLDFDRYAWRIFAGGPDGWYEEPASLVAATAQAHTLVRSDILCVKLLGPFSRHLVDAHDAAAICKTLEEEEPRRLLAETLDALHHQFGESLDLVVECPSPRALKPEGATFDVDDLDDVAVALLNVIRAVADRPIRGLQITCDTLAGPDEDETDAWSVLLSAADHYGWVTAIRLNGVWELSQDTRALPGDLVLLPHVSEDLLPDDRRHGGGLPPSVWNESSDASLLADAGAKRQFRFGEIPDDASPEVVLSRLTALANTTH